MGVDAATVVARTGDIERRIELRVVAKIENVELGRQDLLDAVGQLSRLLRQRELQSSLTGLHVRRVRDDAGVCDLKEVVPLLVEIRRLGIALETIRKDDVRIVLDSDVARVPARDPAPERRTIRVCGRATVAV